VSEQSDSPEVAVGLSVQLPLLEKLPVPLEEKLTVPVGLLFAPESVSVTVAVQVVWSFSASDGSEQSTLVVVARLVALTLSEPPLVACEPSPP
jgi:hypothetical protein